jgi:hypothetical protein
VLVAQAQLASGAASKHLDVSVMGTMGLMCFKDLVRCKHLRKLQVLPLKETMYSFAVAVETLDCL